jgi:hypothetical protein
MKYQEQIVNEVVIEGYNRETEKIAANYANIAKGIGAAGLLGGAGYLGVKGLGGAEEAGRKVRELGAKAKAKYDSVMAGLRGDEPSEPQTSEEEFKPSMEEGLPQDKPNPFTEEDYPLGALPNLEREKRERFVPPPTEVIKPNVDIKVEPDPIDTTPDPGDEIAISNEIEKTELAPYEETILNAYQDNLANVSSNKAVSDSNTEISNAKKELEALGIDASSIPSEEPLKEQNLNAEANMRDISDQNIATLQENKEITAKVKKIEEIIGGMDNVPESIQTQINELASSKGEVYDAGTMAKIDSILNDLTASRAEAELGDNINVDPNIQMPQPPLQ